MQRTIMRLRPHGCLLLASMLLGAAACGGSGEKTGSETAAAPGAGTAPASNTTEALANTTLPLPPDSVYSGPLFQLSHAWPTQPQSWSFTPPWREATHGQPVTTANAMAYTLGIKKYITPAVRQLLFNYSNWNAGQAGWFNQPWLASIREPIHGMYVGSTFPAGTLTGQTEQITTYVITYYDSVAAYTVGNVWGQSAAKPTPANAQFRQNAVIIKLAFQTGAPSGFPAMNGTAEWQIYAPNVQDTSDTTPQLQTVYLMQVDMIVKDTVASPKTGWVFTTLVYDRSLPPLTDAWDRMVPLGAMWGNDPQATTAGAPLQETFIYPAAPAYAKSTLGWGGRLSGPNDGAVVAPAVLTTDTSTIIPSVAASSCMSCHGAAEYPMQSFLLPSPTAGGTGGPDNSLELYPPGSTEWMRWFQDRPGSTPQDAGTTALDYDMVFAFQSIPNWAAAQQGAPKVELGMVERIRRFRQPRTQYNGVPLPEARQPRRQ